jgi:hypothetical protein
VFKHWNVFLFQHIVQNGSSGTLRQNCFPSSGRQGDDPASPGANPRSIHSMTALPTRHKPPEYGQLLRPEGRKFYLG